MYASNDGGYPGDPPPDGANPNAIPLPGVTITGKRPPQSWASRQWSKFRAWVGKVDKSLEGNFRDIFDRKLENPDGGGIVFTSNRLTGGNEQRIGGKNADQRFVNVDDMSFFGGGYSPIGTPGFGGKINDFTNALDRGHQIIDKYTDHGKRYIPGLDSIIYTEENGARFHDTIPMSDLPGYREKVVNGAIILVPR